MVSRCPLLFVFLVGYVNASVDTLICQQRLIQSQFKTVIFSQQQASFLFSSQTSEVSPHQIKFNIPPIPPFISIHYSIFEQKNIDWGYTEKVKTMLANMLITRSTPYDHIDDSRCYYLSYLYNIPIWGNSD